MIDLRERLAQMMATARAATPGPWRQGSHETDTVFVQMGDPSLMAPPLGRVLLRTNQHFSRSVDDAAHIATFSPDVAAALVAVADAAARNQEMLSTEVPPGDLTCTVLDRDRALTVALDALADTLGAWR